MCSSRSPFRSHIAGQLHIFKHAKSAHVHLSGNYALRPPEHDQGTPVHSRHLEAALENGRNCCAGTGLRPSCALRGRARSGRRRDGKGKTANTAVVLGPPWTGSCGRHVTPRPIGSRNRTEEASWFRSTQMPCSTKAAESNPTKIRQTNDARLSISEGAFIPS